MPPAALIALTAAWMPGRARWPSATGPVTPEISIILIGGPDAGLLLPPPAECGAVLSLPALELEHAASITAAAEAARTTAIRDALLYTSRSIFTHDIDA
jgi:hypothetical protein